MKKEVSFMKTKHCTKYDNNLEKTIYAYIDFLPMYGHPKTTIYTS